MRKRTSNAERPTSKIERKPHFEIGRSELSVGRLAYLSGDCAGRATPVFGDGTEHDMRGRILLQKMLQF
jgi:hypothetical protein